MSGNMGNAMAGVRAVIAHEQMERLSAEIAQANADLAEAQRERDRIDKRKAEIRRRGAPDWMLARYAAEHHAFEVWINQLHDRIFVLQNEYMDWASRAEDPASEADEA